MSARGCRDALMCRKEGGKGTARLGRPRFDVMENVPAGTRCFPIVDGIVHAGRGYQTVGGGLAER